MLQRFGQFFSLALNALLFGVTIAFAIAFWREPASAPFALRGESATAPGSLKRGPRVLSDAWEGKPIASTPTDALSEINCKTGLASCRRWIAIQERKGRPVMHSAQR